MEFNHEERQMIVSAWSGGGGTYGIRVGVTNRQRFFNSAWKWIEVEIDGNPYIVV